VTSAAAYYTLSRTIDLPLPATAEATWATCESLRRWAIRRRAGGYDRRHNVAFNFIYDIPVSGAARAGS